MKYQVLTKKRVLLAACLVLVATLGVFGTAGYLAFVRAPDGTPAEACAGEQARPVVVNAGASMTQGTLGGDWVGALREKPEFAAYEFVNAGVNGDTSADLLARVDTDVMACRPAAVTVLVGTNDVRNGVPLADYRANLTGIVDRLKSGTNARIALMSLPPLGEDPDTGVNRTLSGFNAAIKETAARAGVDYLPVHERMTGILAQRTGLQPYDFSFPLALWAATEYYVFGQSWDDVTRGAGRELLIDHIHLNDRGAAQLTELATDWLARRQH
ncbi:GDSL-type esterase/lipase family protein [Saccharothrix sp. AJ9571]|nr:GDSL-type esterase/lipase family protein [Saccharothrix sp. AJ9571]